MGALLDIEVVQGAAVSEVGLRLRDRRDEAVTSYADSATLGLRLSRGPGLPDETLSGGSGWSWNDADAGTVDLTIDADDTADLDPGDYTGYLTITANDVARSRPVFILHVIEGADEDAELPATYCSVRDVVDEVPWIQEVLTTLPVARRQMFAERSSARRRIDETLMSRARFALESQARAHVPVLTVDPIEPVDGVDAGPTWGPSIIPNTTIRNQLDDVQGYLDDDKLMIDDRLRKIAAMFTVADVCEDLLGMGPGETPYQTLAVMCERKAVSLLYGWRGRLDTDDDGVADLEL